MNVPATATTPLRPRRPSFDDPNNNSSSTEQLVVSSYNPDESVLGTSPPFSGIGDDRDGDAESEFSDNSVNWIRQNDSGRFPLSLAPDGRFDSAAAKEKQSKKPQVGSRKGKCTVVISSAMNFCLKIMYGRLSRIFSFLSLFCFILHVKMTFFFYFYSFCMCI